ncbi:MAG: hypothetical protein EA380_07000 [Phycisphaeraceae bacterium]|nr:MAG: hypothetical protein EA380_07000 [Phycisphaeraceae bacterium]
MNIFATGLIDTNGDEESLFSSDGSDFFGYGAGWVYRFGKTTVRPQHGLELFLTAPDEESANQAFALVSDCMCAIHMENMHLLEDMKPTPIDRLADTMCIDNTSRMILVIRGVVDAAELAAKASKRHDFVYAISRLALSCMLTNCSPYQVEIERGRRNAFSDYPLDHVRIGTATLLAYSAIEQIGLGIDGRKHIDKHGKWLPQMREEYIALLCTLGIDQHEKIPWMIRGKQSRIQSSFPRAQSEPASWQSDYISDEMLSIPDAVNRARILRNKFGGHAFTEAITDIRIQEAVSVQYLAHSLIIPAINHTSTKLLDRENH